MLGADVRKLMDLYPAIFLACHSNHVRDPRTREAVSAHQASILDHLDEIEPMSLKDLARHMGVTPATMSVTIDRLEAKGYVRRTRATQDKRMIGLRLTASGTRLRDAQSV